MGRPATLSNEDPAAAQLYVSDGKHEIIVQSAIELGPADAQFGGVRQLRDGHRRGRH
jgi:hypothetical protein